MSESKKGIHQVGPTSFLFFNTPEIFYSISFEIKDSSNIRFYIIKIQPTETYLYHNEVKYSLFDTGDSTPQNTIKKLAYLIYNYNFIIKEGQNKLIMIINSRTQVNLELFLYNSNFDNKNDTLNNPILDEQMKEMQNKIQDLLNIISNQEKKLNEYRQKEEVYINKIKKIEQVTSNLSKRIENQQNMNNNSNVNNNNTQNNVYTNNNQLNKNPYNSVVNMNNYQNYNSGENINNNYNNNFNSNINNYNTHIRTKTTQNLPNYDPNIISNSFEYNPYIKNNSNMNSLLTRPPQYQMPPPHIEFPQRTINLDNTENMGGTF